MTRAKPLRLLAQDAEDLAVISAAMQDAVGKVGDINFEPKGRRLTVAFNRYRWESGGGDLRATVECVEAVLADVSPPWPTPRKPAHEV